MMQLTHLPSGQNGHHFGRQFSIAFFINENDRILIQISLKYVARSPIDNEPVLVQTMAWRQWGDRPLPGAMMSQFIDAHVWH